MKMVLYIIRYTVVCLDCLAVEKLVYNLLLLTGNVFEKAYDIPSHLHSAAFYVAVCLKVLHDYLHLSALEVVVIVCSMCMEHHLLLNRMCVF